MHRCLFVVAMSIMGGSITYAEVVFSNLGASEPFRPLEAWWIAGPATAVGTPPMLVGNFDVAAPFVVDLPHEFRFDTAELPLSHSTGTNSLVMRLLADVGGLPGSELANTTIGGIPDIGSPALVTADFAAAGITLEAGLRYWLAADSITDASVNWHQNTIGAESVGLRNTGDWFVRIEDHITPAFRISGTIVPELASVGLAAVAALVIWLGRRRR